MAKRAPIQNGEKLSFMQNSVLSDENVFSSAAEILGIGLRWTTEGCNDVSFPNNVEIRWPTGENVGSNA